MSAEYYVEFKFFYANTVIVIKITKGQENRLRKRGWRIRKRNLLKGADAYQIYSIEGSCRRRNITSLIYIWDRRSAK